MRFVEISSFPICILVLSRIKVILSGCPLIICEVSISCLISFFVRVSSWVLLAQGLQVKKAREIRAPCSSRGSNLEVKNNSPERREAGVRRHCASHSSPLSLRRTWDLGVPFYHFFSSRRIMKSSPKVPGYP